MSQITAIYHGTSSNGHILDGATRQLWTLSRQVAEIRESKGLSQQDVANITRQAQQHVSRVEHGQNCQLLTFLKVCQALGIRVVLEEVK